MKRTLVTILTILVAALTAAAVALAAPSVKLGTVFTGSTVHKHYSISIGAKCSAKKCSNANAALITVTAGSRHNASSPCEFGGYALPLAKIASGKFTSDVTIVEPKGPITFKVTGKFRSPTKVTGTIAGSKSCGGTDTFTLTGKVVKAPSGPTG